MNIITKFLIKQLLLIITLLLLLLALVIISFSHYLESAQQQKTAVITQFVANNVNNDTKLLARHLRQAYQFQSLSIQQPDGTSVYQSAESPQPEAFSYPLLVALGLLPNQSEVLNPRLNIKLKFTVSQSNELAFLDTLLLILFFTCATLAIVSLWMIKKGIKNAFSQISLRISQTIEQFIIHPIDGPQFSWQRVPASFSPMIEAVKKLAAHVGEQIDELKSVNLLIKSEAFTDELTGLPNRNRFVQYFEEQLNNVDGLKFGALSIIRCTELQHINQTRGYQEGDKYIIDIMDIIKLCAGSYDKSNVYRLNGADFACLLPNTTTMQAEAFAASLQGNFNEYQRINDIDSVAYTGLINYKPGKPLGEILALADTAISIAQTQSANAWHLQKEEDILDGNSASLGNQNWRQVIDDVIAHNRVSLMYQTIQPSKADGKCYSEVLTRFKTSDDQILPTASLLAMAEKLDKIAQIDRMIVEATINNIKTQNLTKQSFGINITQRTVHDEQFLIWLERRLLKDASIATKLVFEVSEFSLQQNVKASKRFIDMIHRVGSRITVERFGVGMTSFKFFRDLKPDFIKMDGTYTRNIDEDQNNQYFMRLIIDLAHRIGVSVFAEGVETQSEKQALEKLFIDGTQGYYIGKPVPF
jgi:diguanylate cyclase (GGDEF)-like protein